MNKWGSTLVALGIVGLIPDTLRAQVDPPAAPPEAAPPPVEPSPPAKRPLFSGVHLGAYAAFEEIPGVLLGLNIGPLVLAGGSTFEYDGNGLVDGSGMRTNDNFSASATISAAYVFYNIAPVAMGPALAYSGDVAPNAFDRHVVNASWVMYFAPFQAPIVLVTVLSARLTLEKNQDPIFELVTPSVLIGYLIH